MALSVCETSVLVDANGKEITQRGTAWFPVACYDDNLSEKATPVHWHDDFEVFTVISGSVRVLVGGETVILSEQESMFVNSEVLHGLFPNSDKVCRIKCICWDPSMTGGREDSVFWQIYTKPVIADKEQFCYVILGNTSESERKMRMLILDSWKLCVDEMAGYELEVRYGLSKLLGMIIESHKNASVRRDKHAVRQEERLKKMLAFIHDNYTDKITVDRIAEYAIVSKSEVMRCFHSMLSCSPMQYTRHYRLEKAAQHLENGSSVSDAAYGCGFNDLSYFAKEFKKKYGILPRDYMSG